MSIEKERRSQVSNRAFHHKKPGKEEKIWTQSYQKEEYNKDYYIKKIKNRKIRGNLQKQKLTLGKYFFKKLVNLWAD